jgi:hypothetical protein
MQTITKCLLSLVLGGVFFAGAAQAQSPLFRAFPGRGLLNTVEANAGIGMGYQALWGSGNSFWRDVSLNANSGAEGTVYLNPYSRYFDNTGNAMQGHADAVNGNDKFLFDPAPGDATKPKAKPDNGRRAMDAFLYEGAHESAAEEDNRLRLQDVRHSLSGPTTTEILTGKALNDLLGEIKIRLGKAPPAGFVEPAVPLDQIDWKHLNVTSAPGAVNMGVLRDEGTLVWPPKFRELAFRQLRDLLMLHFAKAVDLAKTTGQVPPEVTKVLDTEVEELRDRLKALAPSLTFDEYSQAKAFVNHLESAIKGLERPDAGSYFNGKYSPTSKSVPDLVRHMSEKNLSFAAALPGDESAYTSLYRALVTYGKSLIAQTGGL